MQVIGGGRSRPISTRQGRRPEVPWPEKDLSALAKQVKAIHTEITGNRESRP